MASQYEIFDNVIAIVVSPKQNKISFLNAIYAELVEKVNEKFIVESKRKPNKNKILTYAHHEDIDKWAEHVRLNRQFENIVTMITLEILM